MNKQFKLMEQMEENRKTVAVSEAYRVAIQPLIMNEEKFLQMSPKAQEEILNHLGQINKYWK